VKESIIKLTPALAAKWLARHKQANGGNGGNWRAYSVVHAEFLAYEILGNRFLPDTSKLVIAEDGYIVDGQHRVNAVLLADTAVTFTVVEGAPRNWGEFIDCGKTRSVAQRLQLPSRLTSVASTMLRVAHRTPKAGTAHATKAVLERFQPAYEALETVKGWGGKQKHAPAPIRAAILLLTMEHKSNPDMLAMFSAYLRGDLETLAMAGNSGLVALYRASIDDNLRPTGDVGSMEAMVKAYAAFSHPKKKRLVAIKNAPEAAKAFIWPPFSQLMGLSSDSVVPRKKLPGKVARHAQA
jgi:hypothetical protein